MGKKKDTAKYVWDKEKLDWFNYKGEALVDKPIPQKIKDLVFKIDSGEVGFDDIFSEFDNVFDGFDNAFKNRTLSEKQSNALGNIATK